MLPHKHKDMKDMALLYLAMFYTWKSYLFVLKNLKITFNLQNQNDGTGAFL